MKVNVGKLVAGGCAAGLLAVLGVVAVQAHEVSACWADFEPLADNKVFPAAYPVPALDTFDDPVLQAARTDAGFRAGTAFTGDAAVGAPVWTIAAQGPGPVLADQFGLLAARGGAAPADLAMYEGRNGKRHWMRTANKPVAYFMKNLRALTFAPQPDGSTHVLAADARSGYLQWCRAAPLAPAAGAAAGGADEDGGWATDRTGNARTVLMVGKAKGGKPGWSTLAFQDVVTGGTARSWSVEGAWTDAVSDGKQTYTAAPGAVAAYKPGVAAPLWRVELPAEPGESAAVGIAAIQDGRLLVGARQPDGRAGALAAFDTATGRLAWTHAGADPADVVVAGGMVLVREERTGRAGVAAYRIADGTPVWFTEAGGLRRLSDGGADGIAPDGSDAALLYLPGERGPRILRIADGSTVPTTLSTPVDRIFTSGQRIVAEHTASPELSWTIAYLTPKAQADKPATDADPRQR
ncbi:PQQ-like beta-propeller repeat protein [Yinghuangia soli]|uniref:PQQ-like beta-propeller repeat protein n=1 Tax=Yinghuangia soli TaxID=2908204 RepID=A0AA41U683_9ACTN|nr:PQQ-like beta-propeller repeat protein [Yinghuangia soli]MCF2532682.1 PQQ-like beta-propeller repeat protein [Yinghuangia soli]